MMQELANHFIAWANENAHPLKSFETADFNDLAFLEKAVGGARLVTLGESQHYTKEFNAITSRIFEFLVSKMGFSVFVYETPFVQALRVDEYVQGGDLTLEQACREGITEMFGGWKEIRSMVRWMREYNLTHPDKPRLHFYGADIGCEGPSRTLAYILDYFKVVDPEYAENYLKILKKSQTYTIFNYADLPAEERDEFTSCMARLQTPLGAMAPIYAIKSGKSAWSRAHQASRNAVKIAVWFDTYLETGSPEETDSVRDGCMAENLKWILEEEGSDCRLLYHSHSEHIRRQMKGNRYLQAGIHLDFLLGKESTVSIACMSYLNLRPDDICPKNCLQYTLSQVSQEDYLLDLRNLPEGSKAKKWAGQERADRLSTNFTTANVLESYDIIAFTRRPLSEDIMEFRPYPDTAIIKLDPEIYDRYTGVYRLEHTWFPGPVYDFITIERHGDKLFSHSLFGAEGTPDPSSTIAEHSPVVLSEMFPISETRFFWKNYCAVLEFKPDASGKVSGGEFSYYYLEEQKYPISKVK